MNITKNLLPLAVAIVALADASVRGQIVGLNAGNSSVTFKFIDINSTNSGNTGSLYTVANPTWNGSAWSISQTDGTTGDSAAGTIDASGWAGNSYPISITGVSLSQPVGNTGWADLNVQFTLEYQLNAINGLASGLTQFPNFSVSGTVQSSTTSYARIWGQIDYFGVNSAGVGNLIETVTYNWSYNTWGPFFNQPVNGVPVNGFLPALGPGSTLQLVGNLTFEVDPANLTVETVPEPGTMAMLGLGALGLLTLRRRQA